MSEEKKVNLEELSEEELEQIAGGMTKEEADESMKLKMLSQTCPYMS